MQEPAGYPDDPGYEEEVVMQRRTRVLSAAMLSLTVALVASPAQAVDAPPPRTPADSPGGCARNGQEIADNASGPGIFGETVRDFAPIADENALFFELFCGTVTTQ